jgi:hypothetical protein
MGGLGQLKRRVAALEQRMAGSPDLATLRERGLTEWHLEAYRTGERLPDLSDEDMEVLRNVAAAQLAGLLGWAPPRA